MAFCMQALVRSYAPHIPSVPGRVRNEYLCRAPEALRDPPAATHVTGIMSDKVDISDQSLRGRNLFEPLRHREQTQDCALDRARELV